MTRLELFSATAKRAAVVETGLSDLPSGIIAQVLHPNSDLTGRDAAALFASSRGLSAARDFLQQFYYAISVTYFRVHYNDSALRVTQALYSCSRIKPNSSLSAALVRLSFLQVAPDPTAAELLSACTRGHILTIEAGLFKNIQELPLAFQTHLIYNTMRVPGAFDELMGSFTFPADSAAETSLKHAYLCQKMTDSLLIGDVESIASHAFNENPMRAAGCLLWINRAMYQQLTTGSRLFLKEFKQAVHQLYRTQITAINEYKALLQEFQTPEIQIDRIPDFVNLGIYLNGALPIVYLYRYLNYAPHRLQLMDALVGHGFNVKLDLISFVDLTYWAHTEHGIVFASWFMAHGADVNLSDKLQNTALIDGTKMRSLNPSDNIEIESLKFLVDAGADVLHMNAMGSCAISLLTYESDLPLLKYFVEHGRPNFQLPSDSTAEPFLFSVLRRRPHISIVKYLVRQGKLNLKDRNRKGQTPEGYCREIGSDYIADWLRRQMIADRPQRHSLPNL